MQWMQMIAPLSITAAAKKIVSKSRRDANQDLTN